MNHFFQIAFLHLKEVFFCFLATTFNVQFIIIIYSLKDRTYYYMTIWFYIYLFFYI